MAFNLFGYQISKKDEFKAPARTSNPVSTPSDGASVIYNDAGHYGTAGGYYGHQFDLDGVVRGEMEAINQYRTIASFPEVDGAIEAIVNEAVIVEQGRSPVELNLDGIPDEYKPIRESIIKQFDHVLDVLQFNDNCHDIFKRWYIDGRLYYFVLIDPKDSKRGIVDLKYVDPRKIRKVVEYKRENKDGIDVITGEHEYYLFNDNGLQNAATGLKIATDSIINVRSGLIDANTRETISHLFKGIKPANQLKMMEDALVIYRITRAPERRVFYIDVGNLPGLKAEQYVNNVMNKFRNKVVYDAQTGEIKNNKNFLSCQDDFFMPRREGGKATEIVTLPGCLAMDTQVPLLDGRTLSIREIADEWEQGNTLWAYSTNPETGAIAPGLITWAGVTQKSAKVMKLTFDNGESVTCTLDHKFPVWNKGFVRADQLEINDSMIPFYQRYEQIDKDYKNTYHQFYDNQDHKWYFTHRKVVDWFQEQQTFEHKKVIHHKDLNRYNNNPDNLVQMDWFEHAKLHSDLGFRYKEKMIAEGRYEEWKQWKIDVGHYAWESRSEENKANWQRAINQGRREFYDRLKATGQWEEYCSEFAKSGYKTAEIRKQLLQDPEYRDKFIENCKIAQRKLREDGVKKVEDYQLSIDNEIAQFSYEYLIGHWKGNDPKFGCLCDHLNQMPEMVDRLVDLNQNKYGILSRSKTFQRKSLVNALTRYFGFETKQEFVQFLIANRTRTNSYALIDDEIAKFIVDICKQPVKYACSAKRIAPILNNTKWVLERMDQINDTYNWRGMFTADNVSTMVCRYYNLSNWKEFKQNYNNFNHRIIAIEYLDEPIEVGTLTVDGREIYHDYHTFALACGVFTKNSQNLSEISDIEYFQKKLYQSLNVPRQRLMNDNIASIGNPNEVTREEIAFSKFIQRLRNRFNVLFKEALRIQLISTKTIRPKDWEKLRSTIFFEYQHDNYFEELKRIEVFNERMTQLQTADAFKGSYFSKQYIVRNILELSEEQWDQMQQQMHDEKVEESREAFELENQNFGSSDGNEVPNRDSDDQDDGYDDFVAGNDDEPPEEVEQSGDTTDTIDDDAKPNPGEDDFDRPATPGLTATM